MEQKIGNEERTCSLLMEPATMEPAADVLASAQTCSVPQRLLPLYLLGTDILAAPTIAGAPFDFTR